MSMVDRVVTGGPYWSSYEDTQCRTFDDRELTYE